MCGINICCAAWKSVQSLGNDHVTHLPLKNALHGRARAAAFLFFVLACMPLWAFRACLLTVEKHTSHVKPRLKITNQLLRYDPPDLCAADLSRLICKILKRGQWRFKRNWPLLCSSLYLICPGGRRWLVQRGCGDQWEHFWTRKCERRVSFTWLKQATEPKWTLAKVYFYS